MSQFINEGIHDITDLSMLQEVNKGRIVCNQQQLLDTVSLKTEIFEKAIVLLEPTNHLVFNDRIYYNSKYAFNNPITQERLNNIRSNNNIENQTNKPLLNQIVAINQTNESIYTNESINIRIKSFVNDHLNIHTVDITNKQYYICDCKLFSHTGIMCSHVIATYRLLKQWMLLDKYCDPIEQPNKRGRQRNRDNCYSSNLFK